MYIVTFVQRTVKKIRKKYRGLAKEVETEFWFFIAEQKEVIVDLLFSLDQKERFVAEYIENMSYTKAPERLLKQVI